MAGEQRDRNAQLLVSLALNAMLQAQQYQLTLAKAQAEGRAVTDEEVAAARAQTRAMIDALAAQPLGGPAVQVGGAA